MLPLPDRILFSFVVIHLELLWITMRLYILHELLKSYRKVYYRVSNCISYCLFRCNYTT